MQFMGKQAHCYSADRRFMDKIQIIILVGKKHNQLCHVAFLEIQNKCPWMLRLPPTPPLMEWNPSQNPPAFWSSDLIHKHTVSRLSILPSQNSAFAKCVFPYDVFIACTPVPTYMCIRRLSCGNCEHLTLASIILEVFWNGIPLLFNEVVLLIL